MFESIYMHRIYIVKTDATFGHGLNDLGQKFDRPYAVIVAFPGLFASNYRQKIRKR